LTHFNTGCTNRARERDANTDAAMTAGEDGPTARLTPTASA
jgi:hypothetical protein